jgi:hypothetical protein
VRVGAWTLLFGAAAYHLPTQRYYFTCNVTVVVCVTAPEVAVTVIGYEPAGVPAGTPPLPQATAKAARIRAKPSTAVAGRRRAPEAVTTINKVTSEAIKNSPYKGWGIWRTVVRGSTFLVTGIMSVRSAVPETSIGTATDWPAAIAAVGCGAEIAKSPDERDAAEVVPLRLTSCGLPGALSVTDRDAFRTPLSLGRKVTVIVHWPPAGKVTAVQVLVCVKSVVFAPEPVILFMVIGVVSFVFVSVIISCPLVVFRP